MFGPSGTPFDCCLRTATVVAGEQWEGLGCKTFKVISRLFWLLDMLKDIVRANHIQVLIVPTKKRCVIESSFLV